ncbi:MAG: S8 family serine peptidase [Deltaproteobacteria bacterium]|nr:S8 family serine peptidase [Deltaproteobacteria bacterium]
MSSKKDAPADLQAVFALQEDTDSRNPILGLKLARRTLPSISGVSSSLTKKRIDANQPTLGVIKMDRFPSSAEWLSWADQGIESVKYLGQKHWLIRLTTGAEQVYERTKATFLTDYKLSDKIAPKLDRLEESPSFFDADKHHVVLDITLVPTASEKDARQIREQFHREGVEYVDESSGGTHLTIVTEPFEIHRIAAVNDVIEIHPGAWKAEALMDGVRAVARGENVVGSDGKKLRGKGIRATTNESFGYNWNGSIHEAFWNHDSAGQITTPRWTDLADQLHCGNNYATHGLMTNGVLLGNGWFSDQYEGGVHGYRGIAPEATYECYHNSGARAHLSSHSYVTGVLQKNKAVVGDDTEETHQPHVIALGNNGLPSSRECGSDRPPHDPNRVGYYSVCNPHKNLLGVANAQVNGEIYAGSSAGPTRNGRIKPDISAPTGNTNNVWNGEPGGFAIDIYKVEILRDGETLVDWNFLQSTSEGWGEADAGLGNLSVQLGVVPLHGRIQVTLNEKPWGTHWARSPVVGTDRDRFGSLLKDLDPEFVGEEGDVLRVTYRAPGLGYFEMRPIWFRDHPYYTDDDCTVPPSCAWHSQSAAGGLGIGDGALRTMEVPIGLSLHSHIEGTHPHWGDGQTWAGERIEFLGFRFSSSHMQPTPTYTQYYNGSSGGTSGASPVLGGAYALAMENLTRLHPSTDLDQKNLPSIYFTPMAPSFHYGMPLNSTWKALFVHTADDMIRTEPTSPDTPPNPDTGAPNVYHAGPDYTTGYGLVDIQSAIDLMNMDGTHEPLYSVTEARIEEDDWHTYDLEVAKAFAIGDQGIKVTLVWDDCPTNEDLVNNLSLVLEAPDGTIYYPWSLKVPSAPVTSGDIVPAQRDQPNDRDNIEQVLVDDLENAHEGTWKVHVTESGLGNPNFIQKYSLVTSPWDVEEQCHSCD